MLGGLRDPLLSLVYPQECRVCGDRVKSVDHGVACEACWASTKIFGGDEMLCNKCGAFFVDQPTVLVTECPHCKAHTYDKAFAVGVYEKALAASIVNLKSTPAISRKLKHLMACALSSTKENNFDLIVPIPLSKQRRIERGFNQAAIIAAAISRSTRVPVDEFSLERHAHTPIHRVGMDRRARELSVQNAFKVGRPRLISGKNILLVDDVLTSGATASYCAKVLKRNGAGNVFVFTLARAVMR